MLEERYKRTRKYLDELLKDSKKDNTVKTNSIKANVCDINVIDLERIISTLNNGVDISTDVFFKTIKPIVKTAILTASVWNYVLETPLRTIKTIRKVENEVKDNLSQLYELKTLVSQQTIYIIYILLFLIKNRVTIRVSDLSKILSSVVNLMAVITDLSQNCPLVKDVVDSFLSSETIQTATDVENFINDNIVGATAGTSVSDFNTGYVSNVINTFSKLEGNGLNYNFDNYIEQIIDFITQNITFLNNFQNYLDDFIAFSEATVTDGADTIVQFIRDLGVDEYLVSITGLESCLNIIKKYDTANAKEYTSYYKKLSSIPKALDVMSIDSNIYTINKTKLQLLIIKFYMYKREQNDYNTLTKLIDNLDCVTNELDQEKSNYNQKDTIRIRNFTFFATYHYGCNIIMKFFKEQISDTDIQTNENFINYVAIEEAKYLEEIQRKYYDDLATLDETVFNAVQEIFDTFETLTTKQKETITQEAKNNISGDYNKLTSAYNKAVKSSNTFVSSSFINDPTTITDVTVRNEVIANQSDGTDLTEVYNKLLQYYFDTNLSNVMDMLTKREYRDVIDNITTKCVNQDDGELFFIDNYMIVELFGKNLLYEMNFEQQLNEFINNPIEDTAEKPSLRFMVNEYIDKLSVADVTYNSNFTLDEKLQDIVERHFSGWKKFDATGLLDEYIDIVRNLENDSSVFDPNGVKETVKYLKELFVDEFKVSKPTNDYTISNEIYNVAKIEQFFNSVSQIVSDKIA